MKVLIASGVSSRTQFIISNLEKLGFEVDEWTFAKKQTAVNQVVPVDREAVFVLTDFLSHGVAENLSTQAAKRGIHFLRMPHRWAFIYQELVAKNLIHESPSERITMGATPDKAPEALVVGGYLEDRPEIYSRMIHSGWKVKDHWLAGEGGHEYNKARNGIKMIVVLRDTLENKQYQQAHTLAQLSRVPIIKWDVNRELFRKRLEQQNLLYQPLEVPAPVVQPTVPTISGTLNDVILDGDQPIKPVEFPIERRSIPATSAFDSLVATSRAVIDELLTNPLFKGVTIKVNDNGSAEIVPLARTFKISDLQSTPVTEPISQFVGPQITGSHDPTDRSIRDPTLEPKEPKPRPVFQPVPPKIEAPPTKPVVTRGVKGRGKGHLKGQKLVMDCRYPGCKTKSLGPRFGFMCKAHADTPIKLRKEYQKLWNATHINP